MSSKAGYIVSCSRCQRTMGELDTVEYFAFVSDENDSGLCFDCDPSEDIAQRVNLMPFDLGTLDFLVRVRSYERIVDEICKARAHERTHGRALSPGLSSYTKLNRNTEFAGVLEYLYDHRICPGCDGLSFNHDLYGFHPCEICNDKGEIKVLKKWVFSLIGGVAENV